MPQTNSALMEEQGYL